MLTTVQRVPFQCHARFLTPVLVDWPPRVHKSAADGALSPSGPASWDAGTPCGLGSAAATQLVPFQWNATGVKANVPVWWDPTAAASAGEKLATPLKENPAVVVTCCQLVPFQCSARLVTVLPCGWYTDPAAQPS